MSSTTFNVKSTKTHKTMDAYDVLALVEETAEIIAEGHGMNVSYCESMDMDMFTAVCMAIIDDEDVDVGDLHFLAENGRLIPKRYAKSSLEEIREYLIANKDEILAEIKEDCERYQEEYEDLDEEDWDEDEEEE